MKRRLAKLWARMRATVRNESCDVEFQAEMEEHVRLLAERYREQGMKPDAAILAAQRQFGNTALLEEDRRAIKTIPSIDITRVRMTRYAQALGFNSSDLPLAAAGTSSLAKRAWRYCHRFHRAGGQTVAKLPSVTINGVAFTKITHGAVLVQREMESGRSLLASI